MAKYKENEVDIQLVVQRLYPTPKYNGVAHDYAELLETWEDERGIPTWKEIEDLWDIIKQEVKDQKWNEEEENQISQELRKIAKDKIKTKKQKKTTFKELFDNFEERETEPHSDDELVELRKDVQMLKQMVAALLDNVVKENKD